MIRYYYDHGRRLEQPEEKQGLTEEEEIAEAAGVLDAGGIVCTQGDSAYYLVCRADAFEAVRQIRVLKQSFYRPFAICYADAQQAAADFSMTEEEQKLLENPPYPIVLVRTANSPDPIRLSCPEQGVSLAPGHFPEQLTKSCGPLVITSANRWHENIPEDEETLSEWMLTASMTAGFTLMNSAFVYLGTNREFSQTAEQSVVRLVKGYRQVLRRAAGLLDKPIPLADGQRDDYYAAGSDEDTAFVYTKGNVAYLSRNFGNLKTRAAADAYERELKRMRSRLAVYPDHCVADYSDQSVSAAMTAYEAGNAGRGIPFVRIQHEEAHAASVLMEKNPYDPAVAAVFDNAHRGTDGTLWGMDFFSISHGTMVREAGLFPRELIGDAVVPGSAVTLAYSYLSDCDVRSALRECGAGEYLMKENFRTRIAGMPWTDKKASDLVYAAVLHKINTTRSSSLGALLFCAAAILGQLKEVHYPLEAADIIERLAVKAKNPAAMRIEVREDDDGRPLGNAAPLLDRLVDGVKSGENPEDLAAGIFPAIAEYTRQTLALLTKRTGVDRVILAGGLLANRGLLEALLDALEKDGVRPEINEVVPPGDQGIALGQAYGLPGIL
jgi:hydrogenase maturation protein HypF